MPERYLDAPGSLVFVRNAVAVANAGHKTDLNQPEWHGNTQGDGRLSCVWLCSHRFAFANH